MKLHSVRLNNLNSLYGEHTIDFDRDLEQAPLFLILGPTGSGKSTILDAICLALFAQTPRLTFSRGRAETDARHIMSYGTGRCLAEVTFSKRTREGDRRMFRATWECRRAYDKASGNLQDPERSLVEVMTDGSEVVLATGKRRKDTGAAFDEVLEHLTVDEFRRSILLAQGEFAAFLQASEKEKASILERLTNTDDYKVIGQRAAEKRRTVKQAQQRLLDRLDGVELLDPTAEQALRDTITEQEQAQEQAGARVERCRTVRGWINERLRHTTTLAETEVKLAAAKEKLAERAEDLRKLEEDERCQPAEAALRGWQTATKELEALRAAHPALVTQRDAAATARQEAEAKLETCIEAQKQATATLEAARPQLDEARVRTARCETAREAVTSAQQTIDTLKTNHAEAAALQEKARAEVDQLKEAYDAATREHDATQHAHGLVSQFSALAAQTRRFVDDEESLQRQRAEHRAGEEARDALVAEVEALRGEETRGRAQTQPQAQAVQEAKDALTAALAGAEDVPTRRAQLEEVAQQQRQTIAEVDAVVTLHEEVARRTAEIVTRRQEFISRDARLSQLHDRLSIKQGELARVEELHHEQQRFLANIEDTLALVTRRRALSDEEPCPLCGSHDHPWVHDEELHEKDQQLLEDQRKLTARIKRTDEDLSELREDAHKIAVQIEAHRLHLKAHDTESETLREACEAALERYNAARAGLELSTHSVFPEGEEAQGELLASVQAVRAEREAQLDATLASVRALGELQDAVAFAEKELAAAHEHVRALEQKIVAKQSQVTARQEELDRQQVRVTEAAAAHELRARQLHQRFTDVGFDVDAYDGFSEALDAAKAARDRFEAAKTRFEQTREAWRTAAEAATKLERDHAGFADELRALEGVLAERQTSLQATERSLREVITALGVEGDLDAWKAALEADVAAKQRAVETARAAVATASEAHAGLVSRVTEREKDLEARTEALVQQRHELDRKLDELFLSGHEDLEARLLDPTVRRTLREDLEELRRDRLIARTTLSETKEKLRLHDEARLETAEDEPALDDAQAWEDRVATLTSARDEIVAQLGASRQRLATQEEAKEKAAAFKDELDALSEELRVWETINKLIGRNDGDSFKQFAQSLNLGELVDRANLRLERLAPRYSLAVAMGDQREPLLSFTVRDRHQASAERPLTTLSGGETFLVSLALALALSDFRRMEMPVETLLLDEGFGTLDQETLDVAMSTLRHLQQESEQQIGLISHVEALKERIDTRIMVEKLGNGRSTLHILHGDERRY